MSKGVAIHIGLNGVDPNQYNGWSGQLAGCVNDANAMRDISTSLGYTAHEILNSDATAGRVLQALDDAAAGLGQDDILFLTYSGHGGRVPFVDAAHPDGQDDTWVLYDRMVLGNELFLEWMKFAPGARIVVLSDSCHSGTVLKDRVYNLPQLSLRSREIPPLLVSPDAVVRDIPAKELKSLPAPVFRVIPPAVLAAHLHQFAALYASLEARVRVRGEPTATALLISGCQDNQTSQDGASNGLFTQRLLEVWDGGNFSGDYPAFHQAIVKRMPPEQTPNYFKVGAPNAAFEAQTPFTVAPSLSTVVSGGTPKVTGPASLSRDDDAPTFNVFTGTNHYYVSEVASQPELFDREGHGGERTNYNFWASWVDTGPRLTGSRFTMPSSAWQALRQNNRLYYRIGTTSGPTGWDGYTVSTADDQGATAPSIEIVDRAVEDGGN